MAEGFTITDGSVEYEHRKPPAEFHSVTPKVRLNFTIADGSDPDAVVSKVMLMAVRHVEGVLSSKVDVGADLIEGMENAVKYAHRSRPPSRPIAATDTSIEEAEKIIDSMAEPKPRRGRPPSNPTVAPAEPSSDVASSGKSPSLVSDQDAEPETTLTLKGDIQPLAQKVSAHLAKVDGNINKLRAVIKECGGNSLLTIPEARWPEFITEAKKLLPSKE